MNNSKAQGLPMEVIIIAVLLILVLGIIAYVFVSKGTSPFSKGISACKEKGGECLDIRGSTCEQKNSNFPIYGFKGCYDQSNKYQQDFVCCLPG